MTQTDYSAIDYDIFIGIDVDKKSYSFTVKDDYNMKRTKKIPSNPEHFYNYIQKHFKGKKVICAYEAGPTGFHLYDYLKDRDIKCIVTPPISIPKAPNERVKTNKIDSNKIADELMSGNMNSIRVPQGDYRELRNLIKTRNIYAYNRKSTRQRIKALLLSENLYPFLKDPDIRWSCAYIKELKNIECSPAVRCRLDMLLMDLEYARRQILSIHRILRKFCRDNSEINEYIGYLQSISGIGFNTAVTTLGLSGDPKGLKNPREIGAFIGLVPRENSTGEKIKKGSITHLGSKVLRFMPIEAARVAIRKDIQLNQFYCRIKKRHHPQVASRKAIVAVARKLTLIMYCVLKEKRNYIKH